MKPTHDYSSALWWVTGRTSNDIIAGNGRVPKFHFVYCVVIFDKK